MKKIIYSLSTLSLIASGCASAPPRVLSVKSEPAEANVCIKGKFGSELISQDQQCIGATPFESDKMTIQDKEGKKHIVKFNEIDPDKDGFYLIVNRKGYSSQSSSVPAWEHFVVLKQETPVDASTTNAAQLAKTGIVKITSEPVGAIVYINDTLRGNTPFVFEGQAGMAKVKIEHPDHIAYEGIMSVNSGESRELNIKLPPTQKESVASAKSSVRIDSVPSGALIYIDGAVKGNAPYVYEGAAGSSVKVRLEMGGRETQEKTLRLGEKGKEMNVSLNLPTAETREPASETDEATNEADAKEKMASKNP